MSKIIPFKPSHKSIMPEMPICPDMPYYLCRADLKGTETYREPFDGSEFVVTVCPECGEEFRIDFFEFCEIVGDGFDFYGTRIFCPDCSEKRRLRPAVPEGKSAKETPDGTSEA